jgi:hypothetical protein
MLPTSVPPLPPSRGAPAAPPARGGDSPEEEYPELGPFVQEFRARRWGVVVLMCLALVIVCLPVVLLVGQKQNPGVFVPTMIVLVLGIGGTFVFGLCWALAFNRRVIVCENGLLIQGLGSKTPLLWTDVEAVTFQMQGIGPWSHVVTLRKAGGRDLTVPMAVRKQFQLFQVISDAIKPLHLPRVYAALDRGESVDFGEELKLTPRGLLWSQKLVPYDKVGGVLFGMRPDIKRAVLFLSNRKDVPHIETAFLPNLEVLLTVLEDRYGIEVKRATTIFL